MIVIITGKAGSGKTTLKKLLLEKLPVFSRCVSYTTRMPRMGEREGIDYCFVSKSTFMEKKDIFLKREENGNFYGIDRNSFQNKNIITILDLNGIAEIVKFLPQEDIRVVYLNVSQQTLINRLTERGNSLEFILKRLSRDTNITKNNIMQTFPKIPLLIVDNEQPLVVSLEKALHFIAEPRVLLHKKVCIKHTEQNQNIKN